MKIRLVTVALAVALSACSGGWTRTLPLAPTPQSPALLPDRVASAAIVVRVPKRRHHTRARFVSPSTQSATITIAPASGCASCSPSSSQAFGLTKSSHNCTSSSTGLTCTLSFSLRTGTYTGSMSTYDGALSAGKPSGRLLSENQSFPLTIVRGKSNSTNVTLDGVPVAIQFSTLDLNAVIFDPTTDPLINAVRPGDTAAISAIALDADGNEILGAGAPSLSVSASGGFTASVYGDVVTLKAPGTAVPGDSTITFTLSSPACSESNAVCSVNAGIGFLPLLAIADPGNGEVHLDVAYAAFSSSKLRDIAVANPADVKFNPSGDLFVADQSGIPGSVLEYVPPYSGSPVSITNGISSPRALATALSGDLAVQNGNGVTIYASPYTGTPTTISGSPLAIAFDSSNNLWIGASGSIKRYPSPYSSPNLTITNGLSLPASIAIDSDGHLFVADNGSAKINEYASPYTSAPVTRYAYGSGSGGHVAVSPNNDNFLICAAGVNYELNLKLPTTTNLNTVLGASPPNCQGVIDENAYLWLTDPNTATVYGLAPADGYFSNAGTVNGTTFSQPSAIAAYPYAGS